MHARCPHCGAELTLAPNATRITCPTCARSLRVRRPPQSAPVPELPPPPPSITHLAPVSKPRWSILAWVTLLVGIIAGFAPPGRLLWDLAAIVLAIWSRHRIFGGPSWALRPEQPRKRGAWLANIAFLIGVLDILFVALDI